MAAFTWVVPAVVERCCEIVSWFRLLLLLLKPSRFCRAGYYTFLNTLMGDCCFDCFDFLLLLWLLSYLFLQSVRDSNHGKMPAKTAWTTAIQVLFVLEYLHACGYVNKDLKAENFYSI